MARQSAIQVRFNAAAANEDASALSYEVEDVSRSQSTFEIESYNQARFLRLIRAALPVILVLGIAAITILRMNHAPYSFRIPLIRSDTSLLLPSELATSLGIDLFDDPELKPDIPPPAPPEQELYGMLKDTPAKAALAAPAPRELLKSESGPELNGADAVVVVEERAPPLSSAGKALPADLVKRGTFVPAILETPIEPNTPSGVRALIPVDVKGLGNSATLPKSSRLVGQYYSKESAGRQRIFIIWKQLTLPDGRVLALPSASIAKDKFFDSFGSASMISVLEPEDSSDRIGRVRTGEALRVITAKDVILAPAASESD